MRIFFTKFCTFLIAVCIPYLGIASSVHAQKTRELEVLVPMNIDEATAAFLDAISTSSEVKDAGLTFKRVTTSDLQVSPSQAASLVKEGRVPLAFLAANQVPGVPAIVEAFTFSSLISQPAIVSTYQDQFTAEDSILGDYAKTEMGRGGYVVLDFWNTPSSALVISRSVTSINDLKGLKINAPEQRSSEVLQALGASPTNIAGGDSSQALANGAVDGIEVRVDRSNPYLPAAKTIIPAFRPGQGYFVANEKLWIGLRQSEREAIKSAVEEAKSRARAEVVRVETDREGIAASRGIAFKRLSTLGDPGTAFRNVWLKRAGPNGVEALKVFDQVIQKKPSPVTTPPNQPAGTPRSGVAPRIFFATNRDDQGGTNLRNRFGIDRSGTLACGEVIYTPDPLRSPGALYKKSISVDNSKVVTGAKNCVSLLGPTTQISNGSLILYVHGFNNSFDFAVRRAIAAAEDFGVTSPMLVFSWPSMEQMSGYVYDTNSAEYSRTFSKELIGELEKEPEIKAISLVSHSMGSRVVFQMLEYASAPGKRIESMVFIAPDMDQNRFTNDFGHYGKKSLLSTIYANEHDKALILSRGVNRKAPAGLGGSRRLVLSGIETVDISRLGHELFGTNHDDGFHVPKVVRDVAEVLVEHKPATNRPNLVSASSDKGRYWLILP